MKKLTQILIGSAVLGFASTAYAADIPAKAPVFKAPAQIYNWTGFYVGGHIGVSTGDMTVEDATADFTQLLAGVHAGYNYQFSHNLLIGIEGDLNAKFGSGWLPVSRPTSNWDGSIRARLGVLMTPRSLVYVTGGFAFGNFTTPLHEIDPADTVELLGGARTGWTVGLGIQHALDSYWSARFEYRYTDWGTKTVVDEDGNPLSSRLTDQRVIVGLSYKFGAPMMFDARDSVAVNWTGFYVGGHIGRSAALIEYGDEFGDLTQSLVGGHIGYNHHVSQKFVIGLEADLQAKFGRGFKFDDLLFTASKWDGSIRARLGYTVTPRGLVYVTGGFAFGNFTTPSGPLTESPEEHIGGSRTGWTWGVGIQYALDSNWSARIEYRHTDWGTIMLTNNTADVGDPPDFETQPSRLTDDRVMIGLSLKY